MPVSTDEEVKMIKQLAEEIAGVAVRCKLITRLKPMPRHLTCYYIYASIPSEWNGPNGANGKVRGEEWIEVFQKHWCEVLHLKYTE